MSTSEDDSRENTSERQYAAPYTSKHPVPTVQGFRAAKGASSSLLKSNPDEDRRSKEYGDNAQTGENHKASSGGKSSDRSSPYESRNLNLQPPNGRSIKEEVEENGISQEKESANVQGNGDNGQIKDTSQAVHGAMNAREKRKNIKHAGVSHEVRQVTDPVTHLPVALHDSSPQDLENAPDNNQSPGSEPTTKTDSGAGGKGKKQLEKEAHQGQVEHDSMRNLFPPPDLDHVQDELAHSYSTALNLGIGVTYAAVTSVSLLFYLWKFSERGRSTSEFLLMAGGFLATGLVLERVTVLSLQSWMKSRIRSIWQDSIWQSARNQEAQLAESSIPESTQWLNSLLSSVWSLINPDLFTSLADTLEDVMQASLPKLVRMISVEDLGQGSEAFRILGVRWLPTGAAAMDVSEGGEIKRPESEKAHRRSSDNSDGSQTVDPDSKERDTSHTGSQKSGDEGEALQQEETAKGLQAEEGDFVNFEVAFSYRASSSGRSLAVKSKNAHLYLAFYLPGNIKLPVWVELRGLVGTMRIRLHLCPDPPFFTVCTLTFLGQPKVELSCVPLVKSGLNIMDLPFISSFVQTSIDAALAEYVAPKSLTLDLKDMLIGSDSKGDTDTKGVIMVNIKRGRDFKHGDPGFLGIKEGSSDAYVAVGWAKFGKPVWSTRVIVDDMEPVWDETAFILVGPEELNAEERLRVQLWDSDRVSADDDLGRIEIDLRELMRDPNSHGKQWHRSDGFHTMEGDGEMPGILDWSVGYYGKTKLQPEQLEQQNVEPDIKTLDQLKKKISNEAAGKFREAEKDESRELGHQQAQDFREAEKAMIMAAPPLKTYPTGIFSIQIHQITGLELEKIRKADTEADEGDETSSTGDDLPSSYCTVIINHQTIFKTRTKPKNSKPFFNAGTERLVRDWQDTEVIVSIRDSRVHENDPLLGIVYLPLHKIFRERSQVTGTYPIVGGIGYGRARLSLVFRSIHLQLPRPLLGWDYGTLEVFKPIVCEDTPQELRSLRIKIRTVLGRGKMYPAKSESALTEWSTKSQRSLKLPVRKRYCSCLILEFRKDRLGMDKTKAFAILWLKDVSDDEESKIQLPIWKGETQAFKRAQSNCLDDCGEKLGSLTFTLKFHHGLSGCHAKLAKKSPNLQEVFEVLETANDNDEIQMFEDENNESGGSDSSESDDSGDDETSGKIQTEIDALKNKIGFGRDSSGKGGNKDSANPIEQIHDYRDNKDQLHRRHRGLMQWKGARTADWMKTKLEHGKNHVMDNFKHHEREPEIETEV